MRSDIAEQVGAERDTPSRDPDQPSTDEDGRATVDEPHWRPGDDAQLEDDTESPPEGDLIDDGAGDQATADDSAAQDIPDSEDRRQDPDTDGASESADGPGATSSGSERDTSNENRDQLLADKDAHAAVVDEPDGHTRHDGADISSGPGDVPLGDDTEAPPEGDQSGDGDAEQASEDSADDTIRDSDEREQDPSTDETLDTVDEPVMRPPADWDGPTTEVHRGDELYPGARTPFATTTGLDPNTCYHVEGRGNLFTDDSGTIVRAEVSYGRKGNPNWDLNRPQPNMTYVVTPDANNPVDGFDYRHEFTTDDRGRVVQARTDNLAFGEAIRSGNIQRRIGKLGGEGFEGGHLFARWFGGGRESLNLVPMHWELNRGAGPSYTALERGWATLMQEDPPVVIGNVRILPEYDGSDAKPRSITVAWEENGRNRMREFETNG